MKIETPAVITARTRTIYNTFQGFFKGDLGALLCQLQSQLSEKGVNLPVAPAVRAVISDNYSF